jgi:DNA-binding helix-hairpin-helix protein with protein kinase domain
MMLTFDEYMALRRLLDSTKESEGAELAAEMPAKRTRSRSAKTADKKMSKALEQANGELRKTNGELRKGRTQADVMRRAHKIRRTL